MLDCWISGRTLWYYSIDMARIMKIGKYEYHRCCKSMPCPVCGKPDWCLVEENGEYAICCRIEGGMYPMVSWNGWKYRLNGNYIKPKKIVKTTVEPPNVEYIRKVYNNLFPKDDYICSMYLLDLMRQLKIKMIGLYLLRVKSDRFVYYFPMYDSLGNMVGLKKRNLEGKKWCQSKSRLGIYWPKGFNRTKPTIICEGESDTAAMLGYYSNVLGRPSAYSGGQYLKELLVKCPKVCIIADNELIGLREANRLQGVLGPKSYVVTPGGYKDAREWINSGTFELSVLDLLKGGE